MMPMVITEIATVMEYGTDMFTEGAKFALYTKDGNQYYAFDGNGAAIPIEIDAQGMITADVNNKNQLLWTFVADGNGYLIKNVATGRYMHAYADGVTTTGAYSSVPILLCLTAARDGARLALAYQTVREK